LLQAASPTTPAGNEWGTWKAHLQQQVLELAAALRVNEPELFARRVRWLRRAVRARGGDEGDLRNAVLSLRAAIQQELPEDLQPTLAPALDLAVAALDEALEPTAPALDGAKPTERLALQYLAACLEGEPQRAMRLVLAELEAGLSPAAAYSQVLLPAQKEVGELWHVGDLTVVEERLVSETTRELMAVIAAKYTPAQGIGRTLMAASVAGNTHDIGLRAAADLFQIAGWRCLFLGANVPVGEIARAAQLFDVDLVVLNATLATHFGPLGEAIEAIRAASSSARVLVGGPAFVAAPDVWRRLGADAYAATIEGVVALGSALVDRA
jgi:methanogenic corrinoid protein MtbC1